MVILLSTHILAHKERTLRVIAKIEGGLKFFVPQCTIQNNIIVLHHKIIELLFALK